MATSSTTSRIAHPRYSTNGRTYFEQQRELLLGDIAISFENVLSNINKLNRNLEGIIAVGNEFSSVEALWSQFENVMGKDEDEDDEGRKEDQEDQEQDREQQQEVGEGDQVELQGLREGEDGGGRGRGRGDEREGQGSGSRS